MSKGNQVHGESKSSCEKSGTVQDFLLYQDINASGTVHKNRSRKNLPFSYDKTIMKQTRGYWEEITSADDTTMCSMDKVECWDKKHHKYVTVERPEIVRRYNHAMDGVELFDQLTSYYRVFIRSRKWAFHMIFHAVDFAIMQS
ncbi:uncharacterized protein LOC126101368 [Schistocerca cancellata]|uniref:uncharacterized protein LOC126101368 n=1 Tax=Schistocerca cancellata TaxID=274614 RepID=UPI002117E0D8|nr:uncharacterized protein LOC126101368 [Schistocerca cancellata]